MAVWLRDWPRDRGVAGSIPKTIDFLTNSCGQATNAHVPLFTKQHTLVQAGCIAGGEAVRDTVCFNATQCQAGQHLGVKSCMQS